MAMRHTWLPVLGLAILVCGDERLVVLRGNPLARGAALAQARGSSIRKLFEVKNNTYGKIPGGLARWAAMANEAAPYIEEHAPVAWQELLGAASVGVPGVDREVMLLLAVEYDFYVEVSSSSVGSHLMPPVDKCTGFGAAGVSGQNNDEEPEAFLSASEDVVLSIQGDNTGDAALVYTHPGWPAYMGMNSRGLSVLWQYIDNGERAKGVPTNVLIREMIAQKSLDDALALLERVPRTIPNNFILTDSARTVNVEVSPLHFSPLSISQGFVVHTNHVLFDQDMQDNDIGIHSSKTSVQRLRAFRAMLKERRTGNVTADDVRRMLSTHPVFRDGRNGTDNHTLASMAFDVSNQSMSIWFKGDPHGTSHKFSLPSRAQRIGEEFLAPLHLF